MSTTKFERLVARYLLNITFKYLIKYRKHPERKRLLSSVMNQDTFKEEFRVVFCHVYNKSVIV